VLQSLAVARKKPRGLSKLRKVVDDTCYLGGRRRGAILKEEVWYDGSQLVKYSLAYINPRVCSEDHGRVLGYDNSHGHHHRHFMGKVRPFQFSTYAELVDRFQREIEALWRREDEHSH